MDETILVVKRTALFSDRDPWHGVSIEVQDGILSCIAQEKEFLPRTLMEEDERYKQIIPYLVFRYADTYFFMQRSAATSEQRLKNKYSLGIGGHIRQEDIQGSESIIDWARREFYEEVNYTGDFTVDLLGIINDDTNAVGKVHLGVVLVLTGTSPAISIASELKSGELLTLDKAAIYYDQMEPWTQMVYKCIRSYSKKGLV